MSIEEGTVTVEIVYPHPVRAVFAAWSSADAQRIWGDPGAGWSMSLDKFSFRVGESDLCRFGPQGGEEYRNENRYLVIEPERRIVYATSLSAGGRVTFGGHVAVTFEAADSGTRMQLTEQGLYLDQADSVDGHRAGWQAMLAAIGAYLDRGAP